MGSNRRNAAGFSLLASLILLSWIFRSEGTRGFPSALSFTSSSDSLIKKGINHISLTRQGQLLVSDLESNLFLIDSTGKVLYQYSPRRPAKIHLLEGWNGLRPFAFYRDFQEFVLLDRFLLADNANALDPEKIGYARLVAPGADGNLWVLDESNFQLRKIDVRNQTTISSTPLDLILSARSYDIRFMREYQNQLYLCDMKGPVLLFDQMGNFKKRLPLKNCEWIGFEGEEVYAVDKDTLTFFHPYKLQTRKQALSFSFKEARELVKTGAYYWWISSEGLRRTPIK